MLFLRYVRNSDPIVFTVGEGSEDFSVRKEDMPNLISRLLICLLLFSLCACTGAEYAVHPAPGSIKPVTTKGCGKIALSDSGASPDNIPSELVLEFARYLEQSGLFDEVYCPVRKNDRFDMLLETKFDEKVDFPALNFLRSTAIGASFFLLEPVIYSTELNFVISGRVTVKRGDKAPASFSSTTQTEFYRKLLSPEIEVFQKKAYPATMRATFAQMARQLENYCKSNVAKEK